MARVKMTARQKAFVAALPTVDWVGTDAVLKAGYHPKDRQGLSRLGMIKD